VRKPGTTKNTVVSFELQLSASVDMPKKKATMPQAIEVKLNPINGLMVHLHTERAARCLYPRVALDRREHALELAWKRPHFGTHTAHSPGPLPALGRDHALRFEFLAKVGVVPLAVELGIGQHRSDACLLQSGSHNRR
jgi:hypothetical protein